MREIAKELLSINAVKLSPNAPFTWASGIKSPIYCDNRLTISYPKIRKMIAKGLAAMIKKEFSDVDVIAGTATAGIPHAAWVAEELDLPMVYVRSKPKDHGRAKQIEGFLEKGAKVVLIDDLISTGGSVLKAVEGTILEGGNVVGVVGIFSYQLQEAYNNFKEKKIKFNTLTNYSELIEVAIAENYIDENQRKLLLDWKKSPTKWMV